MPKLGDPVLLQFHAPDGASGKYVRAEVKDSTNTPLVGSPFALPHAGGGTYKSSPFTMPAKDLSVTYRSYDDAGYTVQSAEYYEIDEVIRFEPNIDFGQVIIQIQELMAQLNSLVQSLLSAQGAITFLEVGSNMIEGEVGNTEVESDTIEIQQASALAAVQLDTGAQTGVPETQGDAASQESVQAELTC